MSVPVLETLPNGQVYFRSEANPKDWTMLELQGELQSTGTTAKLAGNLMQDGKSDHLIGLPLGALKLDHPSQGKATLRIGNLLLTGTHKKLAKPLLVTVLEPDLPDPALLTQPTTTTSSTSTSTSSSTSSSSSSSSNDTPTPSDSRPGNRLRCLGVVRGKYLFDTRPAPIVRAQAGSSATTPV